MIGLEMTFSEMLLVLSILIAKCLYNKTYGIFAIILCIAVNITVIWTFVAINEKILFITYIIMIGCLFRATLGTKYSIIILIITILNVLIYLIDVKNERKKEQLKIDKFRKKYPKSAIKKYPNE